VRRLLYRVAITSNINRTPEQAKIGGELSTPSFLFNAFSSLLTIQGVGEESEYTIIIIMKDIKINMRRYRNIKEGKVKREKGDGRIKQRKDPS
jgi:hypothetical protein